MSAQREAKIRELVQAMTNALEPLAGDATAGEIFSASLTHTHLMLKVAEQMGVSGAMLRDAVGQLLLSLPSESERVL